MLSDELFNCDNNCILNEELKSGPLAKPENLGSDLFGTSAPFGMRATWLNLSKWSKQKWNEDTYNYNCWLMIDDGPYEPYHDRSKSDCVASQ